MRVLHDTRNCEYRSPFGAVKAGNDVELALDVWDAPGSTAILRTWTDGVGEQRYEMEQDSPAAAVSPDAPVRYRITFSPEDEGIVWYQFIIIDDEEREWRYGAKNGRLGGEGQLVGWEPPSFRLSVYGDDDASHAWYEPIGGYLYDDRACHDVPEIVATLCENYPVGACRTAAPWALGDAATCSPPELPDMAGAFTSLEPGSCSWFAADDEVFGLWRTGNAESVFCVLVNASTQASHDVFVPMVDDEVSELVAGYGVDVVDASEAGEASRLFPDARQFAFVRLNPVASLVLHFHASERLAKPLEPGLGVLAHITSLPMPKVGCLGTLGAPARAFVDWLAKAGVRYWQVLPVNPTDECGSPYAGISAFAGNTRLLEGGLPVDDADLAALDNDEGYCDFCSRESDWLEPYACFMAIRRKLGSGKTWQEWPTAYRRYDAELVSGDKQLAAYAEESRRTQYLFECQWKQLRAYANERGVSIIGDMPIYVSGDSSDVWAHPNLFQLDADGNAAMVAGCPPDAFAEDGQIWGNPVYDWQAMEQDGYAWWLRRLERAFSVYDYVRLDHFIGFSRYFAIPVGEKATAGAYRPGPGYELFALLHEKYGKLPIIAEDLGLITPHVRALVADCGFLGMDIIQFADGGDPLSWYAPRPEKIVYTGTHDNQTLRGYVQMRYPSLDETETTEALVQKVVTCPAPVRVVPLQDVLGLDDKARMNVPGVAEGNWAWQANAADVEAASDYLKSLVDYQE